MRMRLSWRLPVPLVVAALGAATVTSTYSQTHPFTVEDSLSLERLGSMTVGWLRMPAATVSPDGRWLAFVVQRPRTTRERYSLAGLAGGARAGVLVVSSTGRRPENVRPGGRR